MFNIFKRKYKRSDWLEGLMAAERLNQSRGSDYALNYLNYVISQVKHEEFRQGYSDYLDYFENNLKNL